ncbi:hypothetical protein yberc0001_28200 [Yersinia bercovieri ATCC 43970]|uniref:Uncharacterized protein n=1 Tax=Yersinia bercovieri ATCC 43970 TaxID=349968 RepID=A0ABM9XYQ4_YERBE|nr:hypothetical protein yberc0001_28200 [Yersinia bercovieri ATCC 43970]
MLKFGYFFPAKLSMISSISPYLTQQLSVKPREQKLASMLIILLFPYFIAAERPQ